MAHFQNQYGAVQQTPGYEEMSVQTDAYGNPVHHTAGTTTGVYGITAGTGLGGGLHGLRRSGSSSSSTSSEDDGQGGRRKNKGLKEKIKEKLAGVERSQTSATTTPGGYGVTGEGQLHHHQKKGMMEKIKDKLPGHHHHHHHHD